MKMTGGMILAMVAVASVVQAESLTRLRVANADRRSENEHQQT